MILEARDSMTVTIDIRVSSDGKVADQRHSDKYVVVATNAPVAYDYEYVVQLHAHEDWRTILVPTSHRNYQEGRYRSGLYQFITDPIDEHIGDGGQNVEWLTQWVVDRSKLKAGPREGR